MIRELNLSWGGSPSGSVDPPAVPSRLLSTSSAELGTTDEAQAAQPPIVCLKRIRRAPAQPVSLRAPGAKRASGQNLPGDSDKFSQQSREFERPDGTYPHAHSLSSPNLRCRLRPFHNSDLAPGQFLSSHCSGGLGALCSSLSTRFPSPLRTPLSIRLPFPPPQNEQALSLPGFSHLQPQAETSPGCPPESSVRFLMIRSGLDNTWIGSVYLHYMYDM
jgi:hypothetical protein